MGKQLTFHTYQFELIESDITNFELHEVAIIYYTEFYTLHDAFGEYIVFSVGENNTTPNVLAVKTFVLKFQLGLIVCSYEPI